MYINRSLLSTNRCLPLEGLAPAHKMFREHGILEILSKILEKILNVYILIFREGARKAAKHFGSTSADYEEPL